MTMRSMKGLSMNKMLGSIKRKTVGPPVAALQSPAATSSDSPEVTAHNSVKAFCESGGNAKVDEVLFLPPIVDAAESSPSAAAECARVIRKYMSKDYLTRPSWQYNALMLIRILTDNPGETFTRNLKDDPFVDSTKVLLKSAKDRSVRHMLMELLDDFEYTKSYDENLGPLISMWQREKGKAIKDYRGRGPTNATLSRPLSMSPAGQTERANYFSKSHHNNRLPDPVELASRLEEARTSAKLLEQMVMNTPPSEVLHHELLRELANRCISASRSCQAYMVSEKPSPDNDTMESLIDVNEQLQTALNQHQRAVLKARKQASPEASPTESSPAPEVNGEANGEGRPSHLYQSANATSAGLMMTAGSSKGKETEAGGWIDEAVSKDMGHGSGAGSWLADPFADGQAGSSHNDGLEMFAKLDEERFVNEPFNPSFGTASVGLVGQAVTMDKRASAEDEKEVVAVEREATSLRSPRLHLRTPQGQEGSGRRVGEGEGEESIYEATPKSEGMSFKP